MSTYANDVSVSAELLLWSILQPSTERRKEQVQVMTSSSILTVQSMVNGASNRRSVSSRLASSRPRERFVPIRSLPSLFSPLFLPRLPRLLFLLAVKPASDGVALWLVLNSWPQRAKGIMTRDRLFRPGGPRSAPWSPATGADFYPAHVCNTW